MKKSFAILSVLIILSMLLAACGQQAEPTTAPEPTQAAAEPTKAPEPTASTLGTADQPLTMIFVPSGDTQAILAGAQELDKLILDETGLVVESTVATSYAASIEAMGAGKADIVWFAPFAYVLANDKYDADVLLITLRYGSPTYVGQIIYNKENSDFTTLEDLRGKKFAFTDAASTSGWLYPATLLKANGIDPDTDLEATFVGSHNAAALAVYKGQVDAGACYDDCRGTIAEDFPDVKDKVEILTYTDAIPNDTVSVRKDLPADIKTKLADGLIAISETEAGAQVLQDIYQIGGLVKGDDAMFDPVRDAAKAMGIDLEEAIKPEEEAPAAELKVGLVTDVGKVDDGTFNEYAYKGMMRAVDEFGLESAFIETQQPTDYEKNIEQFASEGFDVIITVGFMLGDATATMAEKYPDVHFAIVDYAYDPAIQNVQGLVFSEDQAGFLAGALAGSMTESKIVGIVAGMEIPAVIKYRKGYEAGVAYVCPDCETLGVYIDSFTDPARGKTAALSQMDEGADVIFGAGGPTGSGGIAGAAQTGAWVIGVDQDEYGTTFKNGEGDGADKLLSSAMKRVDNAVYGAIKDAVEGTFKGGTVLYEAANDGVGLAPFHDTEDAIPADVKSKLDEIAAGMKTGAIQTGVTLGEPAAEPAGDDPVADIDPSGQEVLFWHASTQKHEELLLQLVDEFNSTNEWGITIKPEFGGYYGDLYTKILASITAGETPDVAIGYQNQVAVYAQTDVIAPLDDYVASAKYGLTAEDLDDIYASFLATETYPEYDNAMLSFPPSRSMLTMFYNIDMLKELGYDGTPPATWDEWKEMVMAATKDDIKGFAIYEMTSSLSNMIFSRGGDVISADGTKATFNGPEGVEALTLIKELVDGGYAYQVAESYGDQTDFGAGKVLFTYGSSAGMPYYRSAVEESDNPFDWGVAPMPHSADLDEPVVDIYGPSITVFKSTPEKQLAAWLFIRWFTETEQTARWAEVANYFPIRRSAMDVPSFKAFVESDANYATAMALLPYGTGEPRVAAWSDIRGLVADAYTAVINGEDPQTALDAQAELADDLLAGN